MSVKLLYCLGSRRLFGAFPSQPRIYQYKQPPPLLSTLSPPHVYVF
jgi:hypothetical protein